jgi:hypothetical protein
VGSGLIVPVDKCIFSDKRKISQYLSTTHGICYRV